MHKSIIIVSVLLFLNFESFAQNKSWVLYSMIYDDLSAETSNIQGSNITPQKNRGHLLGIERSFDLDYRIGFLVGSSIGKSKTTLDIEFYDGILFRTEIRKIMHMGIHSGFSFYQNLTKMSYIQLKIRGGLNYYKKNNQELLDYDTTEHEEFLMENEFNSIREIIYSKKISPQNAIHPFIQSELNLGINLNNVPLGISIGIGHIYSPKKIIEGEFNSYFQTSELLIISKNTYYDSLKAIGISIALHYILK